MTAAEKRIDDTFAALADPTRRAILARLGRAHELTVSDIAAPLALTLPGVLKHLAVLERAGLVHREKTGRTVRCRLDPGPLEDAALWLEHYREFWEARLDALAHFVEEPSWDAQKARRPGRAVPPSRASRSSGTSKPARRKSTTRGPRRRPS